ncbi:hypothetical protein [Cupriavidus necator]|nr:hypothetical protein [Cupriavidus necator]
MRPRCGPALGVWLSVLSLAGLCAVALTAWLDPAHAQAWVQLMALCR